MIGFGSHRLTLSIGQIRAYLKRDLAQLDEECSKVKGTKDWREMESEDGVRLMDREKWVVSVRTLKNLSFSENPPFVNRIFRFLFT